MINIFKIIHLLCLFALVGFTGLAFATTFATSLREHRKKILMWSGIASLGVFLTGFGLLGMEKFGMPVWSLVKTACWLLLSGLAGMALRKPEKVRFLSYVGGLVVAVALVMVFFKPTL